MADSVPCLSAADCQACLVPLEGRITAVKKANQNRDVSSAFEACRLTQAASSPCEQGSEIKNPSTLVRVSGWR